MNRTMHPVIILILSLVIAACTETPAPAPPPPTDTPTQAAGVYIPNLEKGQAAWNEAQCSACHGPLALGGIGPQLASTQLTYDQFVHVVRTAIPPKPAYSVEQLPDQAVFDIYAWVRTQVPPPQVAMPNVGPVPAAEETASLEDMRSMTIWTCRSCDSCHGVFAQGGPDGPMLAGINDPVDEELARMRQTADKIPEHSATHISDEIFKKLYEWLKMGCVRDECYQ
ncbi:MAG: hypothetical protein DPW09_09175 [Anaerolineae bacterium]|nr:cytochrome c [Anaerolineales bacterium]MCQ3973600.1 hypothetical protein [Anaerolineae bacterium]